MTHERLNVLMITTQFGGGGAGRCCELLTDRLRRAGHQVSIYAASNPARDPACRPASHWRLAQLATAAKRAGFDDTADLSTWLWAVRPEFAEADVVHLHNLHGNYISLAALPWIGRRKPVVWTLHDHWPLTGGCAAPRTCERWRESCGQCPQLGRYPLGAIDRTRSNRWLRPRLLAAMRPLLVTPSHWLAQRVARVKPLNRLALRVIPNGVDTDVFRPASDRRALRARLGLAAERPTVVMAGASWADPAKGGREAVQALRAVASVRPDVQLLIVGSDGAAILDATGVSGHTIGYVQDQRALAAAYGCADVCLFPSRAENYPLTVLEALACATPVVAFEVGGIPEQIDAGRTGLIARDGDIAGLAAAVLAVLESGAAMRGPARAAAESLASAGAHAAAYVATYEDAIATWRRRHAGAQPRRRRSTLGVAIAHRLGWECGPAPARPRVELAPAPLISVITPSFNQGRFLGDCIQSVCEQRYPRFEHIVIDNCSTDGTRAVVHQHPHVTLIREPDRGQSDAVNKGLARARGEIIAWINADDYYLPGAFDAAVRALASDAVVAGRVQMVEYDGAVRSEFRPHFTGLDHLVEFWAHPYGLCQPGVIFRRSVVDAVGPLRTDLHYAMDYEFWLRVASRFSVRVIDAVLAAYRLHDASKTTLQRHYTGFFEEMERVSRPRWGSPFSARYWRRALACGRVAGELLIDELLAAHRAGRPVPWHLLRRLALRRPHLLLCRNLTSMCVERLLGRAPHAALARLVPRRGEV